MKKLLLFTAIFFNILLWRGAGGEVFSQQNNIDSLLTVLKNTKEDTTKVKILDNLFLIYEFEDIEKAREFLNKAFTLSKKINYQKGLATIYIHYGFLSEDQENYSEALKNYQTSLNINEIIGDKKGIANSYISIGNVFQYQCNYPEALKNYLAALKIYEVIGFKAGIAATNDNIGSLYSSQGNFSEALKNHFVSLKMYIALNDKKGISYVYNNIGIIYYQQGNYTEALKNHLASLKLKEEIGNKFGIANSYISIGSVFKDQNNFKEALKYFFSSIKIAEDIDDKASIISSYVNIGDIFTKQKKYIDSEKYLLKAKKISKDIGYMKDLRDIYFALSELYNSNGNFKKAFENHKLYILYRDSLDNEETRKKTIQSQMTYDFEKKEAVANAEHKKELESHKVIAEEKSRKQKIIILFIVIGLVLVLVFAGFIYRSLNITRKQKSTIVKQKQIVDVKNLQLNQQNEEISTQRDEIEAQRDEIEAQRDLVTVQKEHIEEIHKEVTDSINYAKRIQEAVLPISDSARSILGEHFILFKPKDIVSGDFYWTIKIKNWLIVAVADCTGHGVPGAFMSMLGISFLNEIVQKQEINKANQILNILRKEIINALQQKGVQGEQKDGMDISLLVVNTETKECQWAGANNPLYVIASVILNDSEESNTAKRDSSLITQNDNLKLIELKGDKMPIAIYPEMRDFTNHEFKVNKGDYLYLFSDGFADQFGGTKGRKFMYKKFKEILLHNSSVSIAEQKEILEAVFENWKGEYEQVDDVTILGICI